MPLFKTIEEIRTYLPGVNVSFEFADILPLINIVEKEFIIPILSELEYEDLVADYTPEVHTMSPSQEELLIPCQKAIAYLSYLKWIPMGNLQVGSGGFTVPNNDKMAPASQWRVEDFKEQMAFEGYNGLQDILIYLWSAAAGTFVLWEASEERTNYRNTIILSAKEFQNHCDIKNSFELFLKLRNWQEFVEVHHIKSICGEELLAEIKEEILNDDVSANNQVLLDRFIYKAVAHLSAAEACGELVVEFSTLGLIERSTGDRDNIKVFKPGSDSRNSLYMQNRLRTGQVYLEDLRLFLKNNPDTYPLYTASDAFEDPDDDTEGDDDLINSEDGKIFVM